MDDKQIIELFWQRNENAITQAKAQYGSYCFSVANNILHNAEDSEECLNDTFFRTWNCIPPQKPQNLKLFLAKIARNLALDRYKLKARKKRGNSEAEAVFEELNACIAASGSIEKQYEIKELCELINRFCSRLPKRECNIFVRRYFYVDSVPKIAKQYSIKEDNVYQILSRTRKKLTALIREAYSDE